MFLRHFTRLFFWCFTIAFLLSCEPGDRREKVHKQRKQLSHIREELQKKWPDNRTINLVFHGHSVPAGYGQSPFVNTLDAYPHQLLVLLKKRYPYAVINVIVTAIGGEDAYSGERRMEKEVLSHAPDVVFIDYALNDLQLGPATARVAWQSMIDKARRKNVPVILLTATPDYAYDIRKTNTKLDLQCNMIRNLARENGLGLVDSYALFRKRVLAGDSLPEFMAQVNHPNAKGHALVAAALMRYFE